MDGKTNVEWYNQLTQRDFQNGAVLDEIRKRLGAIDSALAAARAEEREKIRRTVCESCRKVLE